MMIENAVDRTLTLIVYERNVHGQPDVYTLTGHLRRDFNLFYFDRGLLKPHILLDEAWLATLSPIEDELQWLYPGSQFQVSIEVKDMADLYEGNAIHPASLAGSEPLAI